MTVVRTAEEASRIRIKLSTGIVTGIVFGLLVLAVISARRDRRPVDWRVEPHSFVVEPDKRATLLQDENLRAAIDLGTDYLVASCQSDGKFVYVRDLQRPRYRSPDYNVLRHAGAIYALCQRHSWQPTGEVPQAVRRAVEFLHRETLMRLPGRDDLLAVWSFPDVTGASGPPKAKLGGTGLGLVALLGAESMWPGLTHPEDLRALGDFLIYMQKDDGGFYSRYIPTSGGRRDDWTSLFYPGEAALGLARLFGHSGDQRYFDHAASALIFLAESRRGQVDVPADHWALLATAELLAIKPSRLSDSQRDQLTDHAVQVCQSILSKRRPSQNSPYTRGAFGLNGRTTPTATRVEGLMAALTFLPREHASLRSEIEVGCTDAVAFLLSTQCREGPMAGGIPRSVGRLRPLWGESAQKSNRRAGEIRVDYVQHALSAWIHYIQHDPVDESVSE